MCDRVRSTGVKRVLNGTSCVKPNVMNYGIGYEFKNVSTNAYFIISCDIL